MNIIFKIIGVGTVCALLSTVLKKHQGEYSVIISVTFGILILAMLSGVLATAFDKVKFIAQESRLNMEYISLIIKIIGISYLCEYSGAVFTDAGESAIAKKIEFSGKIVIFVMSLPLITKLFEIISELF